jgi:hypothetical protein
MQVTIHAAKPISKLIEAVLGGEEVARQLPAGTRRSRRPLPAQAIQDRDAQGPDRSPDPLWISSRPMDEAELALWRVEHA